MCVSIWFCVKKIPAEYMYTYITQNVNVYKYLRKLVHF